MAYHPIGGRLIPEKLVQLDNLLSTIPGCECRVAPNETLYIINLTADEAAAVLDATADGAKTLFETSVACIGASICQQGVRDSQSVCSALCRPCGRLTSGRCPAQSLHFRLHVQLLRPPGRSHRLPGHG